MTVRFSLSSRSRDCADGPINSACTGSPEEFSTVRVLGATVDGFAAGGCALGAAESSAQVPPAAHHPLAISAAPISKVRKIIMVNLLIGRCLLPSSLSAALAIAKVDGAACGHAHEKTVADPARF